MTVQDGSQEFLSIVTTLVFIARISLWMTGCSFCQRHMVLRQDNTSTEDLTILYDCNSQNDIVIVEDVCPKQR